MRVECSPLPIEMSERRWFGKVAPATDRARIVVDGFTGASHWPLQPNEHKGEACGGPDRASDGYRAPPSARSHGREKRQPAEAREEQDYDGAPQDRLRHAFRVPAQPSFMNTARHSGTLAQPKDQSE